MRDMGNNATRANFRRAAAVAGALVCLVVILAMFTKSAREGEAISLSTGEQARAAVRVRDFRFTAENVLGLTVIGLISCWRGFRCRPGAAGVGRACTESFVESCMAILALDFFIGVLLNTFYSLTWGAPPT